jgi:DNA-binding transcriptional ArsR family regulator
MHKHSAYAVKVLMKVLAALRAAGATVRRVERERRVHNREIGAILDLTLGKVRARFAVEEKRRAPYPNELPKLQPIRKSLADIGTPMLVVPFVSEPLGTSLTRAGWSWADATGNFDLRSDHLVLRQRSTTAPPRGKASRLPQGSGSLAIIRALIRFPRGTNEEPGATALANQVGVSQPRASQVLHRLLELELVARTPQGRWLPDREALLDRFLSEYRGPGGSEQFLYSLDSPNEVAARAAQQTEPKSLAVSADVGPDLVLAWRRPSVVILYARQLLDADQLGLVDAQGRHDANVIVRNPDDVSVFPTHLLVADVGGIEVPLADPTQQVWDLNDLGGADRLEAAGRLREWLLNRP